MKADHIPIPRYRDVAGPAVLGRGFRPFFLLAGAWSAIALSGWLHMLFGGPELPSAMAPLDWHVHEMIYGFVVATIAGFLLTAIPNWTGRLPLQGLPLLCLVVLWLAGRVAVAISAMIGVGPTAAIDLAFLAVFFLVVLREILAGRNWRNLPMAGAVLVLLLGNALMHAEAAGWDIAPGTGWRLGLSVIVMLISLIGGRIVPSFTRNWLARRGETSLPAPFGRIDRLALIATGLALLAWVVLPESAAPPILSAIAALAQGARVARWRCHRTLAEPLVWILHLAYAWLPVGLALLAAAGLTGSVPATLAIHALTAGGIGTITLAVMTRATLGHTGRELHADAATTAIYLAVTAAAVARVAAPMLPGHMLTLFAVSGGLWMFAFGGFALVYGRYLLRKRV